LNGARQQCLTRVSDTSAKGNSTIDSAVGAVLITAPVEEKVVGSDIADVVIIIAKLITRAICDKVVNSLVVVKLAVRVVVGVDDGNVAGVGSVGRESTLAVVSSKDPANSAVDEALANGEHKSFCRVSCAVRVGEPGGNVELSGRKSLNEVIATDIGWIRVGGAHANSEVADGVGRSSHQSVAVAICNSEH
jgi:hypothetical protein